MKLCKECKYLKLNEHCIEALRSRKYHCSKYSLGIILRQPEDIETLECPNKGGIVDAVKIVFKR